MRGDFSPRPLTLTLCCPCSIYPPTACATACVVAGPPILPPACGEDLAHRFLRRQGYTVVARNYRSGSGAGEIDIVAFDKQDLVFIEVKTRASDEFGSPDRA